MLGKILLLSAMIFPFSHAKAGGKLRGDEGRSSPSSLPDVPTPAAANAPILPTPAEGLLAGTPRTGLRLVHDASNDASDASEPSKIKGANVIAFDRRRPASTGKFVRWLAENHSGSDLSRTRLLANYFEFCELTDRLPLRERQLLNAIKKHGVVATRPTAVIVNGKSHRPTIYKVRVQQKRAAA